MINDVDFKKELDAFNKKTHNLFSLNKDEKNIFKAFMDLSNKWLVPKDMSFSEFYIANKVSEGYFDDCFAPETKELITGNEKFDVLYDFLKSSEYVFSVAVLSENIPFFVFGSLKTFIDKVINETVSEDIALRYINKILMRDDVSSEFLDFAVHFSRDKKKIDPSVFSEKVKGEIIKKELKTFSSHPEIFGDKDFYLLIKCLETYDFSYDRTLGRYLLEEIESSEDLPPLVYSAVSSNKNAPEDSRDMCFNRGESFILCSYTENTVKETYRNFADTFFENLIKETEADSEIIYDLPLQFKSFLEHNILPSSCITDFFMRADSVLIDNSNIKFFDTVLSGIFKTDLDFKLKNLRYFQDLKPAYEDFLSKHKVPSILFSECSCNKEMNIFENKSLFDMLALPEVQKFYKDMIESIIKQDIPLCAIKDYDVGERLLKVMNTVYPDTEERAKKLVSLIGLCSNTDVIGNNFLLFQISASTELDFNCLKYMIKDESIETMAKHTLCETSFLKLRYYLHDIESDELICYLSDFYTALSNDMDFVPEDMDTITCFKFLEKVSEKYPFFSEINFEEIDAKQYFDNIKARFKNCFSEMDYETTEDGFKPDVRFPLGLYYYLLNFRSQQSDSFSDISLYKTFSGYGYNYSFKRKDEANHSEVISEIKNNFNKYSRIAKSCIIETVEQNIRSKSGQIKSIFNFTDLKKDIPDISGLMKEIEIYSEIKQAMEIEPERNEEKVNKTEKESKTEKELETAQKRLLMYGHRSPCSESKAEAEKDER